MELATFNPFRYRSYYYDEETNLYYLNSRYYDPEIGRFINADDITTLDITQIAINGLNLYAYCLNNPVNETDEGGYFLSWLLALLITAAVFAVANTAVQLVTDVVNYAITGSWDSGWEDYVGAFIGGFAGGITFFISGYNLGLAFGVMSGIETFSTSLLTNATGKTNSSFGYILAESLGSFAISSILGALFGGTKIAGITIGKNSAFAVFKSGLTKLINGTASKMSLKVISKGLLSVLTLKSSGTLLSGALSGIYDWFKYLIGNKSGVGYV